MGSISVKNDGNSDFEAFDSKLSKLTNIIEGMAEKMNSLENSNKNLQNKLSSITENFENKFNSIGSSISGLSDQISKMQEASQNAWANFNKTKIIVPGDKEDKQCEKVVCEERKCECNCKYENTDINPVPITNTKNIVIDLPKNSWVWERLIDLEQKICYTINELHYLRNVKNSKIENKSYDVRSHYDSINDKEVQAEKLLHEQHRANNIELIHHQAAMASRKRRNLN